MDIEPLTYYTVRLRLPAQELRALPRLSARARRASQELSAEGTHVRFVRAVFVPEDGTCFHLYQAESVDGVLEAARRANLCVEGVAGVVGRTTRSTESGT